ncbi:hypothetical protein SFRURICE_000548 [Spodoptera frugiperda]|nr:hypothetical protein SFRURICE_000548 [Spodoptera frugiperda]
MKSCTILFLLIVTLCACDDLGSTITIEEQNQKCAAYLKGCYSTAGTGGCKFYNGIIISIQCQHSQAASVVNKAYFANKN